LIGEEFDEADALFGDILKSIKPRVETNPESDERDTTAGQSQE
jgi:hypothetical protein